MLLAVPSYILAGSLVIGAAAVGWMAADRRIPIEITYTRLADVTVRPGGNLEWRVKFVQHRRCAIHSDRFMYDAEDVRYTLPSLDLEAGIGEVGVEQEVVLKIPVPVDMAFGPARLETFTRYKCNVLHHIWPVYAPYQPIYFEVVPL